MNSADTDPFLPANESKTSSEQPESVSPSTSELTELGQDTKTVMEGSISGAGVAIELGQKIGKYEIRARLGAGGMGAVYLAFDPMIERDVALKILSPELSSSQIALQRFLAEARAIGRLNHPHVVSIYEIDQWNGQYFLVMELLSGGSVADCVHESNVMPWQEACRIVSQAARGLAAAHEAGMIHRDIKPENLMLNKDRQVKVVDFGLSKLLDDSNDSRTAVTKVGQILGTPQYMSPEQFEAATVDARTDIYSLGATLFRLLTSRFPYHECHSIVQVMSAHMTKPPPNPTNFQSSIPSALNRIIAKSMAKSPSDRFQSAMELALELEKLNQEKAEEASPVKTVCDTSDRPIVSAVIVEPSKLQGAILRDALSNAGVQSVRVLNDLATARHAVLDQTPDLYVTAMQLPDGRGIELLRELCQHSRMRASTIVLNSSDCTIDELAAVGTAGSLILSAKKVRPDEILRIVQSVGPVHVNTCPLTALVDPVTVPLQVVLDEGRVPPPLAELLRELSLLDVTVSVDSGQLVPTSPPPELILRVFQSHLPPTIAEICASIRLADETGPMTVAIHFDGENLLLRAVRKSGIVAICQRVLNAPRMIGLFQGCRS